MTSEHSKFKRQDQGGRWIAPSTGGYSAKVKPGRTVRRPDKPPKDVPASATAGEKRS